MNNIKIKVDNSSKLAGPIIIEVQDKYNKHKVWIVKIYKNSNYYVNQKIGGRLFYDRFIKTTKEHLVDCCIL